MPRKLHTGNDIRTEGASYCKMFFKLKTCIEQHTIVCVKCIQWHYPSANTSSKQQFIGHLLDSIQTTKISSKISLQQFGLSFSFSLAVKKVFVLGFVLQLNHYSLTFFGLITKGKTDFYAFCQ